MTGWYFFEEDHIVSEDFFVTLQGLINLKERYCPDTCFGVSLYNPKTVLKEVGVDVIGWQHRGYAISRKEWREIKRNAKFFCEYDDYNWDWTVMAMMERGLLPNQTFAPTISRSDHIGECGGLHRGKNRTVDLIGCVHNHENRFIGGYGNRTKHVTRDRWRMAISMLVIRHAVKFSAPSQPFGGWGHPRDVQHCLSLAKMFTDPK